MEVGSRGNERLDLEMAVLGWIHRTVVVAVAVGRGR